jgi:hypothetical protein
MTAAAVGATGSDGAGRRAPRAVLTVAAAGVSAAVLLTGCGGSSSTSTTTSRPVTTTTTSTTLSPAQAAELQPLLLTAADFPAGWALDSGPGAGSTKGAPGCVADLATIKGSATRATAVFLGPKTDPADAIQTVASFSPGLALQSAKVLRSVFQSCQGTLSQGEQSAKVVVTPLHTAATGDAGFASQMTLSAGGQQAYFNAYLAVKGDLATFLGWYSPSSSTTTFEQMATKALARL